MPSVPEFLLRKLYVKDSLKRRPDGFEFQLNNTLTAVTVTSLSVAADDHPIPIPKLFLKFPGKVEIPAAFVSDSPSGRTAAQYPPDRAGSHRRGSPTPPGDRSRIK